MATKDNSPGLLSKVAMFVRNPTTNWSDLDQMETSTDSAFSKQALKEMIERKRQNDFVRKREFDQLRKLRKRGAADLAAEVGRPSFFHSSLSSTTDDRASTLKKIDEIEAHMSKQWWKGKQDDDTPTPRGAVPIPPPPAKRQTPDSESAPETVAPEPRASSYAATEAASLEARPHMQSARAFSDTHPGTGLPSQDGRSSMQSRPADSRQGPASIARSPNSEMGGAGFSTSKLYADKDQEATAQPGLLPAALTAFAAEAVSKALQDKTLIELLIGEYLTDPKAGVYFEEGKLLKSYTKIILHPATRMSYDAKHMFINGQSFQCAGADAKLLRKLADERQISATELIAGSAALMPAIGEFAKEGWLHGE